MGGQLGQGVKTHVCMHMHMYMLFAILERDGLACTGSVSWVWVWLFISVVLFSLLYICIEEECQCVKCTRSQLWT